METFTIEEVMSMLGWLLGGVILLKNGSTAILDIIKAFKAPNTAQDTRIKDLEDHKKHVDECLARDKDAIKLLSDGNKVTQRAILALLGHALHGNNITEMEDAAASLNQFLINK